jgi:hypothetical protein
MKDHGAARNREERLAALAGGLDEGIIHAAIPRQNDGHETRAAHTASSMS